MKLSIFCLVAVLAIAVSAQDICNQWTTCGVCTGQGTCGWCTYSGTCESGNQTGSFVGCTTPYWVWTSGFCPATPAPSTPAPVNTCGTASSCTSCTALGSCGWCSFNNQCEQGNSTGSFQGCVSPYWSWTNNQCSTPAPPASICSNYNGFGNCNLCTSQAGCGYCLSSYLCEAGTGSGSNAGDCSGVNWAWSTSQCQATPAPTVPNTCGNYNGNCALCTGQGSCGYCLSSNLCEAGTGSGSNAGDCSGVNWAWTSSQCTAVPTPVPAVTPAPQSVCGDYMNDCIGCTEQGSCGYCSSTNQCEAGTATGSNAGDCSGTNWVWYNSQCNSNQTATH